MGRERKLTSLKSFSISFPSCPSLYSEKGNESVGMSKGNNVFPFVNLHLQHSFRFKMSAFQYMCLISNDLLAEVVFVHEEKCLF